MVRNEAVAMAHLRGAVATVRWAVLYMKGSPTLQAQSGIVFRAAEDIQGVLHAMQANIEKEKKDKDTLALTKEEVREAIEVGCFFDYHSEHSKCTRFVGKGDSVCLLCKRVTEFSKGEGDDKEEAG